VSVVLVGLWLGEGRKTAVEIDDSCTVAGLKEEMKYRLSASRPRARTAAGWGTRPTWRGS
jgi:hypothetical protein